MEYANYLPLILMNLPFIVIYAAAIIVAIVRWKLHPTVSVFASVISIHGILNCVFSIWWTMWIPANSRNFGLQELSALTVKVSVAKTSIAAIALVLTFIAIFGWRHTVAESNTH